MKLSIDKEIAAIKQLFPFKYNYEQYTSPQKKFKLILNSLFELGIDARIVSIRKSENLYRYQVIINFEIKKVYKRSHSAKMHLLKYYIKNKQSHGSDNKKEVA